VSRRAIVLLLAVAACRPSGEAPADADTPRSSSDATTPGAAPGPPSMVIDATAADRPIDLGALTVASDRIPKISADDDIPVDTSTWRTQRHTGAKTEAAVKAAIDAAPAKTILLLPKGTYSGTLTIRRSEIVVRGDCADRGAVVWSHRGNPGNTSFSNAMCAAGPKRGEFCNGDGDCAGSKCDQSVKGTLCDPGWLQLCAARHTDHIPDVVSPPIPWTGPFARDTTTLKLADTTEFRAGDVVWIASNPAGAPQEKVDTDDLDYIAQVTAVEAGQITIDRGLPIDFSSDGAHVRKLRKVIRHAGAECMTLRHEQPDDPDGLYRNVNLAMRGAFESWVSDVDLGDTFNTHAQVERSARVVLTGNRFGEQHKSRRGDGRTCTASGRVEDNPCWNKQAIVFRKTHDSTFADNVVHASVGVELAHASSRNWIAYNYFPQPRLHPDNEPRRALFPHGNYAYANVLEGNVLWGAGEMDTHWGSQGPRYTWFRNVALGPDGRFSTEAPTGGADQHLCSREANYLLNRATRFSGNAGGPIDARSQGLHLERNVYSGELSTGDASGRGTSSVDNAKGQTAPADWKTLAFPDTLNARLVGRAPAFWCTNTVSHGGPVCEFSVTAGGVGALWDGSCKLPAQVRSEGGVCSQ
jgi:hypothetical protein